MRSGVLHAVCVCGPLVCGDIGYQAANRGGGQVLTGAGVEAVRVREQMEGRERVCDVAQ